MVVCRQALESRRRAVREEHRNGSPNTSRCRPSSVPEGCGRRRRRARRATVLSFWTPQRLSLKPVLRASPLRRRRGRWQPRKRARRPRASMSTPPTVPGSDFMVDVIKSLGFEYVAANPGLQLPRPARIAHQLRRQQEARVAHLLPRRIVGRHGARLRQDRRQADDGHGARHRRPAARVDGDLQRLRRPRAGLHRARQHPRRRRAGAATSSGRTACRTRPPWCATTPSGTTRRCRCGHFAESAVRAYKIAMTPPYGAGGARRRRGLQEEPMPERTERLRDSEAVADRAAGGRLRRRRRSREDAGGRRESGDRRRPRGAHAEGHRTAGRAGRDCCRRRSGSAAFVRMNFPVAHPLYDGGERRRRATSCSASKCPDFWISDAHADADQPDGHGVAAASPRPGAKIDHDLVAAICSRRATIRISGATRSRPGDRGRRRSHAAGADRSVQAADHAGSQARRSTSAARSWPRRRSRE